MVVGSSSARLSCRASCDSDLIEPYRYAARSNLLETEHLKRLLAEEPAQLQRYATLATLINRRLTQVDHIADLRMSQGFKAAREFVGCGGGKQLQDQSRGLVAEARAEQRLLSQRERRFQSSAMLAMASIPGQVGGHQAVAGGAVAPWACQRSGGRPGSACHCCPDTCRAGALATDGRH
ncbi:CHASE3 domain-containing protein [Azohydromonas lata]|uniref:CHASE3 domain-containing protein n=1 Tax=Azohydromonas lata TaxID=45677 RepID=A0ABU5I831_9BURK|nr:CHASE3 domain-containing protein [Azohydromonas lata]MDZ5455249.1 CHASE3 domain-containing protein [Azohydromonas lata]